MYCLHWLLSKATNPQTVPQVKTYIYSIYISIARRDIGFILLEQLSVH